jgi:hypothetical protein
MVGEACVFSIATFSAIDICKFPEDIGRPSSRSDAIFEMFNLGGPDDGTESFLEL